MRETELEWLIEKKTTVKTDDTKRSILFDQSNLSKWFHSKKREQNLLMNQKMIFNTTFFISHWKIDSNQVNDCKLMKKINLNNLDTKF